MDALNPQSGLKPQVDPGQGLDRRARRNLLLLACCQAVGQSCNTMMFAATGLSVITFYHRPDLANLPVTMQHIGVMIWVFPAALLMQRVGRSIGFRVGSLFGMTGATVMCIGLYTANFLVMCGGGLILGYAVACLQMYRFAAAELVPIDYRAKAISWVTAGGVAAAVIGPSLVRVTHDLTMPLYLATYAVDLCPARHRFHDHVLHHLPVGRDISGRRRPGRGRSTAAAAVGDCQPATLHRLRHGRHAGVRNDVLHHERVAARHRRLRISALGSPLGHLHACARHVRARRSSPAI